MLMTLPRSWLAAMSTTVVVAFAAPLANAAPLPVKVDKFEGEVVQVRGTEHRGIDKDKNIEPGTQIQTGADGRAQLSLLGAPTIALGHKADLLLHSIDQHVLRLRLASGAMRVDTRSAGGGKSRDVRINVGDLRLRVAAADAWTEIDDRGGQVCLISGRIEAQQSTGPVRLDTPGQCLRQTGVTSQWSMVPATVLEARMAMLAIPDAPVVAVAPPPPPVAAPSPKPPTRIVIVTPEAAVPSSSVEVAPPAPSAPAVVAIVPEAKPVPAPARPASSPEVAVITQPSLPPVVIVPAPVEVAPPAPEPVIEAKPVPSPLSKPSEAKTPEAKTPAEPAPVPKVAVITQPSLPPVVIIPAPAEVATPAPTAKPVLEPKHEPAPVVPPPVAVVEKSPEAPAVKAEPVPTKPKPVALPPEIERTPVASSVALAPTPAMDVPPPIEAPAAVAPTPEPAVAAAESASGADAQISTETAAAAQVKIAPEPDVQTPPPATPVAVAVPQTAVVLAPEAGSAPAVSKSEPSKASEGPAKTAPSATAEGPKKSNAETTTAGSAVMAKEEPAARPAPEATTPAADTEVALAAPASPQSAQPEIDDGRRWRVVLGSMPEKEKADLEVERLNSRGWAVEAREYRVGERHGFRIGFGEFATRELAQVALDEFLVQYPEAPGWLAKY